MRTFIKFSFYLIITLLLITKTYSAENKILFKVNNQIITTIDILNEIQFISIMNKEFIDLEKNKKIEIAKNSLIRDKIKLEEILKFRNNIELE